MGGGLVQPRGVEQVELDIVWRDPPLECDPTRARHGEQVAIPGGLGRVTGIRTASIASRPRVKILIAQRRQRQGAGAKCLIAKGCFGRDAPPSQALLPHLVEFSIDRPRHDKCSRGGRWR